MIANRLFNSTFKLVYNSENVKAKLYTIAYRNLNTQAKESTRRSFRSKIFQGTTNSTSATGVVSETPLKIGQLFLAGSSLVGLGSLAYYGLGFSNQAGILEKYSYWPSYVKERINATYGYFGAGLGVTALSALSVARSPTLMRLAMANGLVAIFASFAVVIGSGMLVRSLPYEEGRFTGKHLAWLAHAGLLGGLIAPVTLLGGPILVKAAWYTAGIIGGLSLIAATAPSEKFLNMNGPLAIGLGAVFAASVGSMFLPPTTRLGLSLYSVTLYGGLVLFSMFMLYDTQRIVRKAEAYHDFDPINESISIYLNTINIFIRLAQILAGGNRRK